MYDKIWLTKNEKNVLNLLIKNAKLSDTEIAKEINITSQAVGRIRKELEEELIEEYTLKLNLKKLGLNIIAIIRINIENCKEERIKNIENALKSFSDVFIILKTVSGKRELRYLAGFKNIKELERFMENQRSLKEKEDSCLLSEITILSLNGMLKNSMNELYTQLINSCGIKNQEKEIN